MKIIKTAQFQAAQPPMGAQPPAAPPAQPPMGAKPPMGGQPQPVQADIELMQGEDLADAISQYLQESGAVSTFQEGHSYPGHGGGYNNMGHNYEINADPIKVDYRQSGHGEDDLGEEVSGRFPYSDPSTGAQVQVEWHAFRDRSKAEQPGLATYHVA